MQPAGDETQGFSRSGMIQLVAPTDLAPYKDFGRRLYWLRVSRQPKERDDTQVSPGQSDAGADVSILEHILSNTVWATQSLTIRNEILGSSNGEADQRFQATRWPMIANPTLESGDLSAGHTVGQQRSVRLEVAERLSDDEQERLKTQRVALTQRSGSTFNDYWVEWYEVPDFYDSHKDDRHYVIDRLSGEVRFGTGDHGMVAPQGRGNVRLAEYHWGGGIQGNIGSNTITRLLTTLPYVAGVTNHVAASGGADHESIERAEERGPELLRHRDRAIAFEDFED
jgi:hypothetical protein